nr:MAG TPA: hypothetical protein [Caudoviricetes sp.]
MKKYIGNILDFNGGVVRMLSENRTLVPHFMGGANSTKEDLVFVSYEESRINPEYLQKNGLKFLTDEEVAHFFRGENIKGEKLERPQY